jgi:hypothetical protein
LKYLPAGAGKQIVSFVNTKKKWHWYAVKTSSPELNISKSSTTTFLGETVEIPPSKWT